MVFLWIVTATLITIKMDPTKFRSEKERENEITEYRDVSCRFADDMKKNVYPPKSTRKKQKKKRNDNNSIISAPVFIFGRTLFYFRLIWDEMVFWLKVIAARAAAGQLMQRFTFYSIFSVFVIRVAHKGTYHHRRPVSSDAFQSYLHKPYEYSLSCIPNVYPKIEKPKLFVYLVCIDKLCARTVLHQLSSFSFLKQMPWHEQTKMSPSKWIGQNYIQTIGQKNRLKYLSIHQVEMWRAMGLAAGSLSRCRVWVRSVARFTRRLRYFSHNYLVARVIGKYEKLRKIEVIRFKPGAQIGRVTNFCAVLW